MAELVNKIQTDEKTFQMTFFEAVFGAELEGLTLDRSTDGHTEGIMFEHKLNVTSYGHWKALSQALIYLCRFNRDGIPIPAKICLVSQEEYKCYIYDTCNYMKYIEDISSYAVLKPSDGINGFKPDRYSQVINFDLSPHGLYDIIELVKQEPEVVKVHIDKHNVYGWSGYYYNHAKEYKQKPEKRAFFDELRNPIGTLAKFIYPWKGQETDFKYIMDILNDPQTQKKIGAFYTPPEYAKLGADLVLDAINRAKQCGKKDYIILDRCAGTGNLEMYFDDIDEDILSHVIVSTYELKEWIVLKDRLGNRVRYIIPPIPSNNNNVPNLDNDGFLSGANALTCDILDNQEVMKYVNNPDCAVILFENPPYVEKQAQSLYFFDESGFELEGKKDIEWRNTFCVDEMKKWVQNERNNGNKIVGSSTNDMANVFIWSGFKYFLKDFADSYIVFSPIKYWKSQMLVSKKFMNGYILNRKYFHANENNGITCIYWANIDDKTTQKINLTAMEINDEGATFPVVSDFPVRKVYSMFSDVYYDNRKFDDDVIGIISGRNDGKEINKESISKKSMRMKNPIFNSNIVGYMISIGNTFGGGSTAMVSSLVTIAPYCANGFYVRNDNFMEKLPMFVANHFPDNLPKEKWYKNGIIMKSADKSEQFLADVKNHRIDSFLFKSLFWVSLCSFSHMRSLNGSDGRLYLNQLCFDGNTLATQKMNEFISNGYLLSQEETILLDKYNDLMAYIKEHCLDEYNTNFTYGLYQIKTDIDVDIQLGFKRNGRPKTVKKYGDVHNMIDEIEKSLKEYYLNNLVATLFEYEFLK